MTEDSLHLDNQLCFSIYACSREVTRFYRPYLEEMGITYPQYITLLVLWEQDGLTVKEIGERLFFRFRYVNTYVKTNGIIKPCKTRSFQRR